MSIYTQWKELIENQTDETFEAFWKEYSETETRAYSAILSQPNLPLSGTLEELTSRFDADPVLFMGFLDGIQESLVQSFPLEDLTNESLVTIQIVPEKLYYNMLVAGAEYLCTLPQWQEVLPKEKLAAITKAYKKTKIVTNPNKTGRNDPCPCGSGKKYKHCCGKN